MTTSNLFFCRGHIEDLPISEQSPEDNRYCNTCYAIIEQERALKTSALKKTSNTEFLSPINEALQSQIAMPRGRPKKELPIKEIKRRREKGRGAKLIAKELATQGIDVSYRTILRLE